MTTVPHRKIPDDPDFVPNDGREDLNPKDVHFWTLVAEDYRTHGSDFFSQGFWALFWHRFGNWRMGVKPWFLRAPFSLFYKVMFKLTEILCGISIPYTVRVGRRVTLEHFGGMVLVAHTIGNDVIVRQNTTFGIVGLDDLSGRPIIGNNVELGASVVILGRIRIGDGAKVGAGAVVVRDVPSGVVVGGVPARVLKYTPSKS
ncbi:MAG: transferase [Pseudomonadota bacterium]